MTISLSIGSRLPAYCTSMGRVLLGGLSERELDRVLKETKLVKRTKYTVTNVKDLKRIVRRDREQGWSLVNQELEEGLSSISVPLLNRAGKMIAAMNVSASLARTTPTKMVEAVLPYLKRTAETINGIMKLRQ